MKIPRELSTWDVEGCLTVYSPLKSTAIISVEGILSKSSLSKDDGGFQWVNGIEEHEAIKHLGCTFSERLLVNDIAIQQLSDNVKIVTSLLLKLDQKLNVLNLYLFPILAYSLQTTLPTS